MNTLSSESSEVVAVNLKLITALAIRGKTQASGKYSTLRASWPLGKVIADGNGVHFYIRFKLMRRLFNRSVADDIKKHTNQDGIILYAWNELAKVVWSHNSAVLLDTNYLMTCRFVMNSTGDIKEFCDACQHAGLPVEQVDSTVRYLFGQT